MGLAIGVFPGLGGIAGLSLLLPFMFGMDPVLGLALMIGMVAVVPTSDTFASVLMGIPGSSASQAKLLDGFPLARRGEAARALSAAFASSLFGGLVGAAFLTVFILAARPVVLAFGLQEMLMVTILGLSMVAILAGRIALKGLAAAGLGLMVGTIGAVALLGSDDIEVGPAMLKNNLDITYSIVWLLALANVVGTLLCIAASGAIARLTTIRFALVAPFLFMLIAFAAFQSGQDLADLVALFLIGLLGIFLRRFDWSRPAFLIGFVLSNPAETFTNQAYQIAASRFRKGFEEGIDYIFSPIVIVLLIVTAVSIYFGIRQAKMIQAEGDVKSGSKRAPLVFLLLFTAYLVAAVVDASTIPDDVFTDKVSPLVIGGISVLCCLYLLYRMMTRPESDTIFADKEASGDDAEAAHGLWPTLAWFGGLLVLSAVFGFIIALAVFLLAFFRLRAGLEWARATILAACGIAFMCLVAGLLNRDFPPGLLQSLVELPWPLT